MKKYFNLKTLNRNTVITLKLSPRDYGKTITLSKNRRIERKFK